MYRNTESDFSPMRFIKIGIFAFIGLLILLLLGSSFYSVDEGERAVVVSQGRVSHVASPGFHFKKPFVDSAHYISTRTQVLEFPEEPVYTGDQQSANISFSVNYAAIAADEEITKLYRDYQTLRGLETRTLERQVRDAIKNVVGRFTAETVIRERSRLNTEVLASISDIGDDLIRIEGVNIENINFSDAVEKAAEERARTEMAVRTKRQELEKTKVENQITVANAQAEADSQLASARAKAEAVRLQGEAEAAAIKAKSDALAQSPNLVELTKAERWDGKLPQQFVPGSTVPFLSIK